MGCRAGSLMFPRAACFPIQADGIPKSSIAISNEGVPAERALVSLLADPECIGDRVSSDDRYYASVVRVRKVGEILRFRALYVGSGISAVGGPITSSADRPLVESVPPDAGGLS